MTMLVDEAEWPWRGDRWAHLVSDTSAAELHAFANRLGIRRLAFQDDHYDVPVAVREAAIALGARPVTSRVLVETLISSGLRVRRRTPWSDAFLDDPAVVRAVARLDDMWPASRAITWTTVLGRQGLVGLSAVIPPADAVELRHPPVSAAGVAFMVERPEGLVVDVVMAVPAAP
jgi:hypothetical protein